MKKIKEIKIVNQDGSTELANIGADAINVDYNNTTVKAELDKLNTVDDSLMNIQTNQGNTLTNLQSQISSLASGSPLVASSVSGMTDTTRVYINTTDGNWYYYDGTNWSIGGVYQATELANNSVTPDKTTFMKKVSILNPDLCLVNKVCKSAGWNNDITDDTKMDSIDNYVTSPVFNCNEGEQYIFNCATYGNSIYMAKKDKAVYTQISLSKNKVWTVPKDIKYFRLVFTINANPNWRNEYKLIKGNSLEDTTIYGKNAVKNFDIENQFETIIVPENTSYSENEAIMLLNFDGWNQHTFDIMAPYLQEKNIPFTLFFTGYDKANGIDINDLKEYMEARGSDFELGLYSGQPSSTFNNSSNYSEQFNQINASLKGFVNYGLKQPKVMSYAGGIYTQLTEYLAKNIFKCKMGRSTENSKINNEITSAFTIPCSGYGDDNVYTLSVVDSIVTNLQHRACMTHNILSEEVTDTSYNMRESYLKSWIDKIAEKVELGTLKCMTFSQYYLYTILPHTANIGQHAIVKENDNKTHDYVFTNNGWVECTIYT